MKQKANVTEEQAGQLRRVKDKQTNKQTMYIQNKQGNTGKEEIKWKCNIFFHRKIPAFKLIFTGILACWWHHHSHKRYSKPLLSSYSFKSSKIFLLLPFKLCVNVAYEDSNTKQTETTPKRPHKIVPLYKSFISHVCSYTRI